MRLMIMTGGSRGDVQPFLALGLGLQAAGYDVTLAGFDDYADFVTGHGLPFRSVGFSFAEANMDLFTAALESGSNTLRGVGQLMAAVWPAFAKMYAAFLPMVTEADAVVAGLWSGLCAFHIAEAQRKPFMMAHLQPFGSTGAFPNPMFPPNRLLGSLYNRQTHTITEMLSLVPFTGLINGWRAELGLSPIRAQDGWPWWQMHGQPVPTLYNYSRHVIPKPQDWGAHQHVTGYLFLQEPAWTPPDDLRDFLAAGPPPVYIGFGSMVMRDPTGQIQMIVDALEKAGLRAILLTGAGVMGESLDGLDLPEHIFPVKSVPHDWLFPQAAAVVHHGGAGTTAAGLRAGVPAFVTPFVGDQPFWARRVCDLGVGPEPIPNANLTAGTLAYAIRVAATHPAIKARAAALGAQIRQEDGVGQAVRVIQNWLSSHHP